MHIIRYSNILEIVAQAMLYPCSLTTEYSMRMNAVRVTSVSVEDLLSGAAVTAGKTMLVAAVARASEGYPPLFVSKNLQITYK